MLLRQLDFLSPPITLYYKQKNTHASIISGILTICSFISIMSFVLVYLIRYIRRENPTIYLFNKYINDAGTFSFKDLNFFNYIQLSENITSSIKKLDFNKIEIIGINITMESLKRINNLNNISHWIYGICDNKIDTKRINYLLNNETFHKSACIKKFYNHKKSKYYNIEDENFEWPIISHGASNLNFKFYGVLIKKCQNTSFRLEHFGNCDPEKEIDDYIKNIFVRFTILDNYVDILNHKNPIMEFLYTVTNEINYNYYRINNLNFLPGYIKSYDNLFNDKTTEKKSYFFSQNSQIALPSENSNYLSVFFIWLQNTQLIYERHYYKLRDLLTEIGGYASATITISKFINYLIFNFNLLSDSQELISNVLQKNSTVYDKMRKSPNIMPISSEIINIKKNNNIGKIFDTKQNNKKEKPNSDDGNDKNNNLITRRINVINNNNLGEETNRFNKNLEDSKQNVISEAKSYKNYKKRYSTRNAIKHSVALIDKEKSFNFCNYLFYLIFCKKKNFHIKYYEELRRLIISEEIMFHNYFNIYKILETQQYN